MGGGALALGWGHLTHHRRLLGQRPPIFQELGEGLHISGTLVLNHLEPWDGRETRSDTHTPIPQALAELGWP